MKKRKLLQSFAAVCAAMVLIMTGTGAVSSAEDADPYAALRDGAEIVEDEENGLWTYEGDGLKITVQRFTETVNLKKNKRTREYCVADIQASPEHPLSAVMTDPTKRRPAGYKLVSPEILIEKYPAVFAMSDDLYGIRLQKYKYYGVVIRNREIIARKTRNSAKSRQWPNLDTLAVYDDGSMKTFVCDAYTPEEYLEQGAVHVFSFGPILISDGVINEAVLDPKYYPYNEPRAAIGMVEPWHYIAVLVKGRPDSKYAGVHLDWLAEKMKEYGCTEALNLDGGLTSNMLFMGKIIISGGDKLRSQGSLIEFGQAAATEE